MNGCFIHQELLNHIVDTTVDIVQAEACSVFYHDIYNNPGFVHCIAGSGYSKNIVNIAKYKIGEGFTGNAVHSGDIFNIKSRDQLEHLKINNQLIWKGAYDHIQWFDGNNSFRNLLALPIENNGQIYGVIKVENKIGNSTFSNKDINICKNIARFVALIIKKNKEKCNYENKLKKFSFNASLQITHLLNHIEEIIFDLDMSFKENIFSDDQLTTTIDDLTDTIKKLKTYVNALKCYNPPIMKKKVLLDINDLLKKEIWYSQPPSHIEIVEEFDSTIPYIALDQELFTESIKELLFNAITVLKDKGGSIFVSSRLIKCETGANESVLIKIEDNGPGFPHNFSIFEPFKSSISNRIGIGLVTVRDNVEALGGVINCNNLRKNGIGASFELILPISGVDHENSYR